MQPGLITVVAADVTAVTCHLFRGVARLSKSIQHMINQAIQLISAQKHR